MKLIKQDKYLLLDKYLQNLKVWNFRVFFFLSIKKHVLDYSHPNLSYIRYKIYTCSVCDWLMGILSVWKLYRVDNWNRDRAALCILTFIKMHGDFSLRCTVFVILCISFSFSCIYKLGVIFILYSRIKFNKAPTSIANYSHQLFLNISHIFLFQFSFYSFLFLG